MKVVVESSERSGTAAVDGDSLPNSLGGRDEPGEVP